MGPASLCDPLPVDIGRNLTTDRCSCGVLLQYGPLFDGCTVITRGYGSILCSCGCQTSNAWLQRFREGDPVRELIILAMMEKPSVLGATSFTVQLDVSQIFNPSLILWHFLGFFYMLDVGSGAANIICLTGSHGYHTALCTPALLLWIVGKHRLH